MTFKTFLLSTAAAVLIAGSASAADLASAPGALPSASSWNPWQLRVRALAVIPQTTNPAGGLAKDVLDIGYSVVPELDITYFFTKNIAVELILGTTPHNVHLKDAAKTNVGDTWLLPPTLNLQYHFTDFGAFKPYVGAGVNYTFFYGNVSSAAVPDLKFDNAFGWDLQLGFDYMIDKHWGLNVDVKKMFLSTTAYSGSTKVSPVNIDPWLVGVGVTYKF